MVILLLLTIGMANGYDLKCPAKAEWRLRGNISCVSGDKYVCLFHLLENRYMENCLGSDRSSIGSKLVFQPLFNLAECDKGRYQPFVFTTHGNSECIYTKSKCDEEGQVVFNNDSTSADTSCRCDYTKGYAFVTRPKNSCFCKPHEEDCSCYRVTSTKLSSDYQCLTDEEIVVNVTCQGIQPSIPCNTDDNTVQIIESNRKTYFVFTAIAVYVIDKNETKDDERQKKIHELFQKDKCGKLYFARLVFIGKNGVGKTSLMRRLLWQKKEDVTSTQSTDGIEIEKCNINIVDGKWSPCNDRDNDLTRMIHQVYKETSLNVKCAAEKTYIDHEPFSYNTDQSNVSDKELLKNSDKSEDMNRFNDDNKRKIIANDIAERIGTSRTDINTFISNIHEAVETNSDRKQSDTFQSKNVNENEINSCTNENESNSVSDEKINKMTSKIMKSYLKSTNEEQDDTLAFCWLWDFAGQKDFYATHQVFLSKFAVYLLVTDSLDFSTPNKYEIDFVDSAQYVSFWFDAIHCYWSTTKKGRLDPPIIVVCTNEDQFQEPLKREERQKEFKENLGRILENQKKKQHLRNIYFISNTEDSDTVFEEIRKDISRQAMELEEWGKDCPLKWLLFQQVLMKLKESNVPISSTTALLKIAKHKDIDITEDYEVTRCLQYCHEIGTVIYFDEEHLGDYVILDPKWLIKAFRCLVSHNIDKRGTKDTRGIDNIIEVSDDWQKLTDTGQLTDSLISRLFRKEPALKFEDNKSHLIEVMKKFDIIVNLKNSTALYMPCMMKSCSLAEVQKKFCDGNQLFDKTSWLCLEFKFLPPAFYNHIIVWYIKQYYVSATIDKKSRSTRNALYRHIGVFNLDKSGCEQLVVCEGPNTIALQVWDSQMSQKTYGYLVLELLRFVAKLKDRYSLHISYTKTFTCPHGDFASNRKTREELVTKYYRCLEHQTNHLSKDLLTPWDFSETLGLTMSTNEDLLVAALDLGTTHSGYAFSMRHEFETDPLKIHANQAWDSGTWAFLSLKTPTCLLLDDKKQLKAIGYEAENYYAEMVMDGQQDEYFYFHRFKINFDNKKNISADMVLKDIHGRPVSAVVVYSLFIGALVDHLMNLIIKQKVIMKTPDIQWVLTIPIWTDAAKQFMRECAEKARIPAKRILLALEPEAASIFCQFLPKEKLYRADDFNLSAEGTRFLVADLGGSSANMTVFEKRQDGHLKELHRASGNHCGGTSVDDKFFQMLVKILGGLVMTKVKDEEPESYLEFSRAFEVVKRTLKTGQTRKVTMRIPFVALERQCEEMLGMNLKSVIASSPFADAISLGGHTLRIDANVMIELFRPTIRNILSLICDILNDKKIKTIGAVLLVGGFSECCLIQDAVMMRFRDTKITIPVDAGLSVLNGAVLFGHTMCNRG